MFKRISVLAVAALTGAALMAPAPALAYDPCQRATERVEQLEREMRQFHRDCPYKGCLYTVGFDRLAAALNGAREQRRRACR